jgi:hypothetical protein
MDYLAEWDKLSKYERRQKIKAFASQQQSKAEQLNKAKKWLLLILTMAGISFLFYRQASKPLPGELMADQGREHVADISNFSYNSNPPTSGPHYPDWTRRGIFNEDANDGNLIHSLEHGYVIVSYNCEQFGEGANCADLQAFLSQFFEANQSLRLIVVPRSTLDVPVALTAWNRILKLNAWDEEQAASFAKAFNNKGPERTME